MSVEKTEQLGAWGGLPDLAKIAFGLVSALVLIQVLNRFGWLIAGLMLIAVIILLVDLNGYRAWLLLLVASLLSGYKYGIGIVNIRGDQVMLVFLFVGWVLALMAGKARFYRVPLLVPALGYAGVNLLASALYSPDKAASYQGSLLVFVYVMMFVMTVLVLQQYPDRIKTAVKALLVLAVAQGLYALAALAANKAGLNLGGVSPGHVESAVSLQGGFEEPNLLGAFAAAIGLVFIALLTARDSGISAWKTGAGAALMVSVLLLTFTRAAWLGFIVGLVLLVFMQKPARNIFNPRAAAVTLAIGAALLVVALPFANAVESGQVSQRIGEILDFSQGSAEGRVELQNQALRMLPDAYLLGNGTLSLISNQTYAKLEGGWLYSSFIQAIHDTGLIGLAILLWFQIGVMVTAARAYLKTKDGFLRASLIGLVAANISLMLASQASSFIWLGFPWVLAGLTVATARIAQQQAGEEQSPAVNDGSQAGVA